MSVNSKMTAIANKIRALLGITGTMGLDAMASNIDKAQTEVDDQAALIEQLRTILAGKVGGIIPTGTVTLTENGIHDVTQYASAVVDVSSLPPGITALNTGAFQITLDAAVTANIPHGLPVTPNFYAMYAEPDFNADEVSNVVVSAFAVQQNATADGEQLPVSYTRVRLDNSGYFVSDMTGGQVGVYFDAKNIKIYGPLTSNVKYRWIAARIDYS